MNIWNINLELFKAEIMDRQNRLLALDRMQVNLELMKKAGAEGDTCGAAVAKELNTGITGSFKRLEID
jgi:hypothetical protein